MKSVHLDVSQLVSSRSGVSGLTGEQPKGVHSEAGERERTSLRLLFLADAVAEDLPGGSRTAARELALGLIKRGHQVTFLVGRHNDHSPDDETLDGVRVLRYAGAGSPTEFIRSGHEACEKLLKEQSFDLVHTHFAYAGLGPLRAVPKSIPRVRTFHGPWDQEGWIEDVQPENTQEITPLRRLRARVRRGVRRLIERHSLGGSAKVLTFSQSFRDMALSRYGVGARQMEMIPGGTDTVSFHPPAERDGDKAAIRLELGLPAEWQILLSVRRLSPRMGLDRLIQAMPAIIAQCPAAHLLIGGQGPEEAHLRHMIEKLGLTGRVQLVGFIPAEQLVSYYQAADLFVLPSMALEGFGLVTTEALSCGLPVVGTAVGATPEILTPLDRRLIALSSDPSCLAEAIVEYLNGTWRRDLTPQSLHDYVCRNFTWENHVSRTEQIYCGLVREL